MTLRIQVAKLKIHQYAVENKSHFTKFNAHQSYLSYPL